MRLILLRPMIPIRTIPMYRLLLLACLLLVSGGSFGQTYMTEDAYAAAALAASPAAEAARLEADRSRRLEGTAYSLPAPIVNMESPSGDFYAVGVLQSFRLPGYYQKQHRLLSSQTGLAQAQAGKTRADIRQEALRLFLEYQYFLTLDSLLTRQSAQYKQIADAAQRLFQAGQQDALQAAFARTQAQEVEASLVQNWLAAEAAGERMRQYAGLPSRPRIPFLTRIDTSLRHPQLDPAKAPALRVAGEALTVSRSAIKAEQAKFRPSFSAGYLNQGPRETPQNLRYRASIDIPIWTRQYRSSIGAARVGEKVALRQLDAARLAFRMDSIQISGSTGRLLNTVKTYQQDLLPRADAIIGTATRLRTAGQTGIIDHLRVINDAFAIKLRYVDLLYQYRQSIISAESLITPAP